jgi:ATP-binding protein involved in chromosome partitioning
MTESEVKALLLDFKHPAWLGAKVFRVIKIEGDALTLQLELGYPVVDIREQLVTALQDFLKSHAPFKIVQITLNQNIVSHQVQQGLKGVQGIKNIIAVGSGKGGVGKSTVSANLALALSLGGAKVGLLDADIYGPSQPQIMGSYEAPKVEDKRVHPIVRYHLATMSMGYLVGEDTPMIWRGPMVSAALQQLLNDTLWGDLDYLIIDLPPGTGDIQLTLCQKIPLSGALIVTTPQDLSLIDARRAIQMFQKVKVPILGVIENMSTYHCPACGHVEAIFGEGAGLFLAEREQVELLGALPLDKCIREDADQGMPTVVRDPEHSISLAYRAIARAAAAKLSLSAKNFAAKFPNIVIERSES